MKMSEIITKKIYEYKESPAVFVNDEKTDIPASMIDDALLLSKYFTFEKMHKGFEICLDCTDCYDSDDFEDRIEDDIWDDIDITIPAEEIDEYIDILVKEIRENGDQKFNEDICSKY